MPPLPSLAAALIALAGCAGRDTPARRVLDAPPALTSQSAPVPALPAAAPASPWPLRRRVAEGRGVLVSPTVRWRSRLGGPVTLPLTVGETGVWAVTAGVVSLLGSGGEVVLSAPLDATTPVALAADGPVVGAADGALLAFSPNTGKVTLAWPGSGRARGGAVPLGSGMTWASSDGTVRHTVGGAELRLLTVTAHPASDEARVYFQTQSNQLVAADLAGPAWRARIAGPGIGPPVVGDGVVLAAWDSFQGEPGGVLAVDPATGAAAWQAALAAPPAAGLALAGDLLLVPLADGTLQALDPASGAELWAARLGPDPLTTAPVVAGRSAWVGDGGGRLHRVDLDDGGVAWTVELGSPVTAGPELAWDLLLVGLSSGEVVAIGEGS